MSIIFLYGALQNHVNVTDIAKLHFIKQTKIIIDKHINFNQLFGDVYPNEVKQLTIRCGNNATVIPETRHNSFAIDISDIPPNPKYSVLITSYECKGHGCKYLQENLEALLLQTYRPLQVVVSDHSKNDEIESMIKNKFVSKAVESEVELIYDRFAKHYGNPCENWNNAAKLANGEFWHYFALDDFFAHADSVKNVVAFTNDNINVNWFACAHKVFPYGYYFLPEWNANILQKNTISGPSAIVIRKNLHHVSLDPQFIWFLDLDWYYRLYLANNCVGPTIIPITIWCNRLHESQLSNTICDNERKSYEMILLLQKYGNPLPSS